MQAERLRQTVQEGKPLEASVLDDVMADLAAPSSEKVPEDKEGTSKWQSDTMAFISTLNTLEATAAEDQVRLVCFCCRAQSHLGRLGACVRVLLYRLRSTIWT
jgi:hypothetical protein